jgi:hypothetical protein
MQNAQEEPWSRVPPKKLTDVPDTEKPVTDGCRTDDERPLIVQGRLRIGPMKGDRSRFEVFENVDLRKLLTSKAPVDTVIEAEEGAAITVLDVDSHHWSEPPSEAELCAHLTSVSPQPDAGWTTHGHGLKLVFIGAHHRDRALAAAFSIPSSFRLELLSHTRHPRSRSSKHGSACCGRVHFFKTDPGAPFQFETVGHWTNELRTEALQKLGLADGHRYGHDRCPLDPGADSHATDCVVVLTAGVYCHRCAGRGKRLSEHLAAGYFPFAQVISPGIGELERHAKDLVHWTHARLVLRHHYPNLDEALIKEAYRRTLQARWDEGDPRVRSVFNTNLDLVRGEGLWLDAERFGPTTADNDVVNGLPAVQYVEQDDDNNFVVRVDPVRRSRVKYRSCEGYTPVRPVKGLAFSEDANVIPVLVPPGPKHAVQLLNDPLPEEEAFRMLEQSFPLLHRVYLKACLAAAICGDARIGQPPMLACTGPSGSGKEQHVRLAASFLGQDIAKLSLDDGEEAFFRQLGIDLTAGERFLVFDEFGKTPNLASKLKMIFQISGWITWRPLFENRLVRTPLRGAIFFPCVRFPDFLVTSQEFLRRTRRVHLFRRVPNWAETSGGDTGFWRDRSEPNALVANSILTHVWRVCCDHDFRFH